MKIFLDDLRNPTTKGWMICRTATSCIKLMPKMDDSFSKSSGKRKYKICNEFC